MKIHEVKLITIPEVNPYQRQQALEQVAHWLDLGFEIAGVQSVPMVNQGWEINDPYTNILLVRSKTVETES